MSGGEDAPLTFKYILLMGLFKSVLLATGSQLMVAKQQEQRLPRPRPTDSLSLSLSWKNLLPFRLRKMPSHRPLLQRTGPHTGSSVPLLLACCFSLNAVLGFKKFPSRVCEIASLRVLQWFSVSQEYAIGVMVTDVRKGWVGWANYIWIIASHFPVPQTRCRW